MNTTLPHLVGHQPGRTAPRPHILANAWQSLRARWSEHLENRRRAREAEALAELNEETLRDIGAPERWVARAVHRVEVQQRQLLEMRQWRGG